jgi:hypothetical protein
LRDKRALNRRDRRFRKTMNLSSDRLLTLVIAATMIVSALAVPVVQADINPSSVTLDMLPGESEVVHKTLDVPDYPPKLDLYLLEDETGSFEDDIETLQALAPQIFDDVRNLVSDSRFGVGGFRDFPFAPWGLSDDWAYRRVQDMASDRTTFVNGVNALTAGGGNDKPESQYEALYQAATGAGKTYSGYTIPPGQNPSFRDDAFKVIVLTTDSHFHIPPDYPGPTRDATVSALNSAGIIVIALKAPGSGSEMDDIAVATGGVVKEISDDSAEIAEAIVDALGEILVDVTLEATCDPGLTVTFSPSSWSNVDPPTTPTFDETVSVDSGFTGILLTCTVTAKVNDEVVIGTQAVTVNVNQPPVADADGPYVADEGAAIEFDASNSTDPNGDSLQYRWDFENDGTWDTGWSPDPTASHTWCDDHTGTAKVEVSDGQLTDTDTASVTVLNVLPVPVIDSKGVGCLKVELNASRSYDPDGPITKYEWDLNNDGVYDKTGIVYTHTFAVGGDHTIGLRVTDKSGLTNTTAKTIYVAREPTAAADVNRSTVPYGGGWVLFDGSKSKCDSLSEPLKYTWNICGSTYYGMTVPYHVSSETTATLTVTDTYGCTDTGSVTVGVQVGCPPPIADADGPYLRCVEYPVWFDGSGSSSVGDMTEYCWDVDDDGVYEYCGSNPIYEYTYPDTYSGIAVLTVTDSCGSDTDTARVIMKECPGDVPEVPILTPAGLLALTAILCAVGMGRVMRKRYR